MKKSLSMNRRRHPGRALAVGTLAAFLLVLVGAESGARTSPALLSPLGLRAQWTFAEGSGTTAGDSSGNSFTGTLTNGPTFTMGRIGAGLNFDGVNDYVKLPDNSAILNSAPAASVSLWIKPSATTASGAFRELVSLSIGSSAATNTSRVAVSLQGNGAGGQIFAGGRSTDAEAQKNTVTSSGVTVGTWTHVAAVFDFTGNTIKVYLNGTLSATNAAAGFASATTPNTACRSCALGSQDTGDSNYYAGAMDEVQVYNRALSASEVSTLAFGDALQARWSFDEGTGVTVGDSTGNNYSGTLKNGPLWTTAGQIGNAVTFTAAGQYLDLGSNLNILRNVNAATVTAWIKPSSTIPSGSFRELVSISVNAASPTDTSRVALALKGDGTTGGLLYAGGRSTDTEPQKFLVSTTALQVGVWAHVGAVIDFSGKTISLFVNGEPAGSGTADFSQSHTPNTASTDAALAAQDTGSSNTFLGTLDETRVYARALARCDMEQLALHDALHAWWKFDETSGTTTADATGNGFTGTLVNGATFAAGQFGNAVSLNGTNQYVNLGTQLSILNGVRAATVATWVKLTSQPATGAFRELVSISVNNGTTLTNTSRVALSVKGNGTTSDVFAGARSTDTETQQSVTAAAALATGTWYHMAAVYDFGGNTIKVYKNGTLIATQAVAFSQPQTPSTNSTNAALGAQDTGDSNWFAGLLDETRVYCRILSDAEILALGTGALPGAPTNLVATPGDTKVTLTWTPGSGSTSTNIYMRLDTGSYSTTPLGNTTGSTFQATGLTNGTKYWFKVTGVNAAGEGPATPEVSATPAAAGSAPPAPVILTPAKKTNDPAPTIVGTANPNVTIKLFFNGTQETATTTSDFSGNWSIKPSAKADGIYSVTAKASNTFGDSPASTAVSITVDTHVNPPTNLVVVAQNTQTQLTWTASPDSDVIGYHVWRSENNGPFHSIHSGVVVGTTYTDTGLMNGTLYCYKVQAVDNTLQEAP